MVLSIGREKAAPLRYTEELLSKSLNEVAVERTPCAHHILVVFVVVGVSSRLTILTPEFLTLRVGLDEPTIWAAGVSVGGDYGD